MRGFSAKREPKGFTLIELLVVITIITSLVGVFAPKFITYSKYQNLQGAASNLQTNIRTAQNNAASGFKCTGNTSADTWYLKFNGSSSYRLEAACAGPTPGAGTPTPTPPVSTVYNFPAGVSIDRIELNSCTGIDLKDSDVKVVFSNISGVLRFEVSGANSGCGTSNYAGTLTVKLKSLSGSGNPLSVIINKGGSVYVQSD